MSADGGGRLSLPLFGALFGMWRDWQNGIPPTREWAGRGAQNPHVVRAFDVLFAAEAEAMKNRQQQTGDRVQVEQAHRKWQDEQLAKRRGG